MIYLVIMAEEAALSCAEALLASMGGCWVGVGVDVGAGLGCLLPETTGVNASVKDPYQFVIT